MKLFVIAIVCIAGQIVTAKDITDLRFHGHIEKNGKLIDGRLK